MKGRRRRAARGLFLALLLLAAPLSAAAKDNDDTTVSSSASELTRQGREHASRGDDALAMRRFVDALRLDPSYGPAYLELGAARERSGDWAEAERTYDVAIEHVPNFVGALRARAALFHRLGEFSNEVTDLERLTRLAEGPETLRALATRHIEDRAWPAALATYRRLFLFAEKAGDEDLAREARTQIRGLAVLAAELDPITAGAHHDVWERRAIAAIAKRRGI